MSQNLKTFRGAAANAVRLDVAPHEHKGHMFTTTGPNGVGKMRFYGVQGTAAGSHFNFIENASEVYGGPIVLFQFQTGEIYGLKVANEQFGISAMDFIEHCLDEKTGDLLNVKRFSDQEIAYYHHCRNQVFVHRNPTQEQISGDRLDVDYRKTGHIFSKTDDRGYGKLRLYGHDGKQSDHSFASLTNASVLYGGVPRFIAQFQSGEFYRVTVDDPTMDVRSFIDMAAQGMDIRAKRMSQLDITEFLLARNFFAMEDRPATAAEVKQRVASLNTPPENER